VSDIDGVKLDLRSSVMVDDRPKRCEGLHVVAKVEVPK